MSVPLTPLHQPIILTHHPNAPSFHHTAGKTEPGAQEHGKSDGDLYASPWPIVNAIQDDDGKGWARQLVTEFKMDAIARARLTDTRSQGRQRYTPNSCRPSLTGDSATTVSPPISAASLRARASNSPATLPGLRSKPAIRLLRMEATSPLRSQSRTSVACATRTFSPSGVGFTQVQAWRHAANASRVTALCVLCNG